MCVTGHSIYEGSQLQKPTVTLTVTTCGHWDPTSELIDCTNEVRTNTNPGLCVLWGSGTKPTYCCPSSRVTAIGSCPPRGSLDAPSESHD